MYIYIYPHIFSHTHSPASKHIFHLVHSIFGKIFTHTYAHIFAKKIPVICILLATVQAFRATCHMFHSDYVIVTLAFWFWLASSRSSNHCISMCLYMPHNKCVGTYKIFFTLSLALQSMH